MDDQAERVQAELIGYAPSSADWNALDARLAEWGYDLHVSRGGGEVYSSLDPFRTEVYRSFSASTVWPSESPLTILDDGIMSIGIQKGGIPWWPCRGRTSPSFRPPAAPG